MLQNFCLKQRFKGTLCDPIPLLSVKSKLYNNLANFFSQVFPKHDSFLPEIDNDESPPEENLHLDAFITDPGMHGIFFPLMFT